MKNVNRILLPLCLMTLLCIASFVASAQTTAEGKVVRGKVINKKDKSPLEHVSVTEMDADGRIVKGTNTDIDGNYALKFSNLSNKISFSFIGFKTITQDLKGKTTINITMEAGGSDLDEVVIVSGRRTDNGNMSVADKDLTVSVAKINAKDLEEMSSASIDQALQGRLAGVDITSTSGDPGAGMSIRIRGTSSINANTNPLIVVDGMPYETTIPSDFNFGTADDQGYAQLLNIAPSDIKEITVLKDAAATAMWGPRAANGVLLISTKRGVIGKPVLTYTVRSVIQSQPSAIPLLSGNQYSNLIPEMVMNRTGTPLNTLTVKEFAYDPNDPYYYNNYGQNTDWLAAVTRTGFQHDHNLSMTGGGTKAKYFASLGYFSQKGTTIGTDLTRITTRINLDYTVSEKIKFRSDFAYTYTDNPANYRPGSTSQEIRNVAINKMPNMSIYEYNEQGVMTPNYFSPAFNIQGQYPSTYNPVAMANTATNRIITNRITPHFNLRYDILPRNVLIATTDIQFDISNTKSKTFLPQIATGRPVTETVVNRAYDGDYDGYNVQTKTNLAYTPILPENHSLTAFLSIQTYDNKGITLQSLTSNTASSFLQDASNPSRTQNQELNVGSSFAQTRTIGALVSAQYSYKGRYIINAGFREDGNSRLAPSSRWGGFPSVSTRWRISDEKFMRKFKFIDDLSARVSYGQTGNAPRYDYAFYNQYNSFGWTYQGQSAVYPSSIELKNLKWEVLHGTNLGFNLILFKRRIDIDLDIYRNRTQNLITYGLQVPTYTGYSSVDMNVGTLDNQGWELNIRTVPVKTKNVTIDFNFNIAQNQNVFREISPYYPAKAGDVTTNGSYLTLLQINNPFGSIYGYKYKGVYSDVASTIATDYKGQPIVGPNGQPIYMRFNYPKTDYQFQPGDAMYEDINHDGNIDYKDVVYLGNSNPKFVGGFGSTISYKKNLKISFFFNFKTSYDVVNGTQITTTNMYGFNNQSTAVLRRWKNPGDVTDMPRALWNAGYNWLGSDRYVQDASFLRLRTVTARYTFNSDFVKKIKFKGLSAYLTLENLLTFTKYLGQDPEVAPRGVTGPFTVVTDNSTTPPVRSITFGLSASF
jgi:TonB-linked SusC/RagA family outer membrane protein